MLVGFVAAFAVAHLAAHHVMPQHIRAISALAGNSAGKLRRQLIQQDPQVVLLGPEWLTSQDEAQEIAAIAQRRVIRLTAHRAGTAWQYLAVKNILPEGKVAIFFFADWQLTFPEYYADSGREDLAYLAEGEEPEVERLAYQGRMPELEFRLRRDWPLYACRSGVQKQLNDWFSPPALSGVFGRERHDAAWQNKHDQAEARARSVYDNRMWDFSREWNRSFLPLILQECARKQIHPVFVECMGRTKTSGEAAVAYREALRKYLAVENAEYLDGRHMDRNALAEKLAEIVTR